ncbi:molybdopterin cofactor-binding domain-containing protein [Variovorax sp. OV329]|uniref:molybdopterin cofactor-binding domain-containing protein n=1 Tax=Variovorax sp. OV329 TaxID=1882825 RepID=UPI0008E6122B|nr:molybdopterin cofactor-binding domain-containing protein [Variovorax sp. OV329]SFM27462.1 nicotinate dehydrogenase subunit B [Variovorax sp. OV329]
MSTRRDHATLTRADFLAADGVLLVVRETPPAAPPVPGQPAAVPGNPAEGSEILLAVWDDGGVTGLNGHVDLGTGLATALSQIVAEELDAPLSQVRMVLGDTARVPNQGATIASASIQIHSAPLRRAAAQARAWLVAQAAEHFGVVPSLLEVRDGRIHAGEGHSIEFGRLVAGARTVLQLAHDAPLKASQDYRIVGQSVPRVDIPAKLSGELVFVHDMRLPGMLHGRVVRPPYAGADHGEFIGNTLESVDESSIAHIPGVRAVVVLRDFVGVVAEREEEAEQAMRALRVRWKPWPGMPSVEDLEGALRDNPATQRLLVDEGDVDGALQAMAQPMPRTYVWPYQMHASIGPSCAVAHWAPDESPAPSPRPEGPAAPASPGSRASAPSGGSDPHEVGERGGTRLRVWAGTQNPHVLRRDLAQLTELDELAVDVVRMEAAGCYGRNGADDVAADAALLSRAVGAPVRVQLTREQEHAWEPKGAAQLMQVQGGLQADGSVAAYDFETSYPSNGAPTLALLLTRTVEPSAQAYEMGDRTARPPYDFDNLRVKVNDMAPIVRASWLRGVSALPNAFAHESYIDELATAAGEDPVAFRLRHLHDPRAVELVQATAQKAGWRMRSGPQENADGGLGPGGDILFGQGFAYARYVHSKWPGFGAAWAAWVADVEVNTKTGEVHVRRVVVGHDAGLVINPAGVAHQVHGNVLQATSRALKEKVQFAPQPQMQAEQAQNLPGVRPAGVVASREWGSYPILNFREVPVIEVLQMPRPGEAPMGAGESASVPGTAAIANAIFDATGVRFRAPPFTPEVVRAALNPLPPPSGLAGVADADAGGAAGAGDLAMRRPPPDAPWPRRRRGLWATGAALLVGGLGAVAGLMGARSAIAPVNLSSAPVYSEATIERGRQLAALGDCAVCHTAPGGARNAGGLAMETPFGTVYTTNLTPDAETGLGRWSFSAFQRAMREGISRDGHRLYPAFPYTAFAKVSDDDLNALYAYLMSQPAVHAATPEPQMKFPFGLRPLMAGWNALFHDPVPYQPDAARSAEWNRGAYLVNGLGHCGACHTPRNALGAEQGGPAYLSGAMVEGWEAPALTGLAAKSAVPWTAESLYQYLRNGHSPRHGIAGGPMAEVVRELGQVPDADIRAMARYLSSFQGETSEAQADEQARRVVAHAQLKQPQPGMAQRLFDGACAACHHDGNGPTLLGVNTPLALNSQLTSARPDNLLRTILEGVREPASKDIGFMPSFADALDDRQIAELAQYMRARFAPQEPAWTDLPQKVREARSHSANAAR